MDVVTHNADCYFGFKSVSAELR